MTTTYEATAAIRAQDGRVQTEAKGRGGTGCGNVWGKLKGLENWLGVGLKEF